MGEVSFHIVGVRGTIIGLRRARRRVWSAPVCAEGKKGDAADNQGYEKGKEDGLSHSDQLLLASIGFRLRLLHNHPLSLYREDFIDDEARFVVGSGGQVDDIAFVGLVDGMA